MTDVSTVQELAGRSYWNADLGRWIFLREIVQPEGWVPYGLQAYTDDITPEAVAEIQERANKVLSQDTYALVERSDVGEVKERLLWFTTPDDEGVLPVYGPDYDLHDIAAEALRVIEQLEKEAKHHCEVRVEYEKKFHEAQAELREAQAEGKRLTTDLRLAIIGESQ